MKMDNLADPMEGVEQYIAEHTSLPIQLVCRIYRLGDPWPLSPGEHIEQVANLSGAKEETVRQIYNGVIAFVGEAISQVEAKIKELETEQADDLRIGV
jgi:hypothetical protein